MFQCLDVLCKFWILDMYQIINDKVEVEAVFNYKIYNIL